ncbi:MAG: DNA cytosine methyltransferase [Prevotella sp.]|nr:DNA cytosine methyltransferase [Candidatus Prevotella equi]
MKIQKPKYLQDFTGNRGGHTLEVRHILPHLPDKLCFSDCRHFVYDTEIFPFALTTRSFMNNQQYLKEPKIFYDMADNNQVVEKKYRIRKLTEREVFRLMDVDEEDIDTLLQKRTVTRKDGTTDEKLVIPSSQHYKLAGNSIVVNCLFLIFRNIYYPEKPKAGQQLSLF